MESAAVLAIAVVSHEEARSPRAKDKWQTDHKDKIPQIQKDMNFFRGKERRSANIANSRKGMDCNRRKETFVVRTAADSAFSDSC